MAILFSQADGSDQHYDTYEEFEQAFVLIKRLNGEKVPQDLLDEVKSKNSDKETKPLQVKIDGNNFESAFRKAVRDVGEELDKLSKDRTPVSDEVEIPENVLKFEVGDKVKVVDNKSGGHVVGTIGEISEVRYAELQNRWTYAVDPISGHQKSYRQHHKESDLELLEMSDGELEVGDKVRVVSADDGTSVPYHGFRIGSTGEVVEHHENGKLEVYNGTFHQTLLPHHYEKVEPLGKGANGEEVEDSLTELEDGDLVRVTESFRDYFGDVAGKGSMLTVKANGDRAIGVGTVLIEDNHDKLQLVCRKEDRKDIKL